MASQEVIENYSIRYKFNGGEDSECVICICQFSIDDEIRRLPCMHVFHIGCVDKWLTIRAACPICRKDIKNHDDEDHENTSENVSVLDLDSEEQRDSATEEDTDNNDDSDDRENSVYERSGSDYDYFHNIIRFQTNREQ